MTFFVLKDRHGNVQLVHWEKGAMPWMKECLARYKDWLEEAMTRKKFANDTESYAAKGGVNGFIWFLDLIGEPVETFSHDYVEELDIDTGKTKDITSNPDIA